MATTFTGYSLSVNDSCSYTLSPSVRILRISSLPSSDVWLSLTFSDNTLSTTLLKNDVFWIKIIGSCCVRRK